VVSALAAFASWLAGLACEALDIVHWLSPPQGGADLAGWSDAEGELRMPRQPNVISPVCQHVVQRGNRRPCFYLADAAWMPGFPTWGNGSKQSFGKVKLTPV
jgi:hypothetical protein